MLIGVWNVYGIFVFSVQSSYRPKAALRNGVGGGGGLVAKSCLTLVISRAVAHQAPLSMGFPRQEYWSKLLFPSPGDFPDPGIKPDSPAWQADSLPLSHLGSPVFPLH